MVDAIVSLAVNRLGDFLTREAVFLGVKDEVQQLQNELRWMYSFLNDAEEKQEADERIRIWVSEMREIAYDAEDDIDTFILKNEVGNDVAGPSKWGLSTSLKTFISRLNKPNLYDIGKKIKSLRKRIDSIKSKREAYGIIDIGAVPEGTTSATSRWRRLRRTTSYADEDHVVGIEDDACLLEKKLFQQEMRRSVISILGMGGLGKTTLARKLYNNSHIRERFHLHAWVCVSQEWRIQDLLERIIKSFKKLRKDELERLERMNDEDMERFLREMLEGQRYLVVVDDIWSTEAWESLRKALPDNRNGSRVIITTRIQAVAELFDEKTYVHRLRFLQPDESWELFCKKAFFKHDDADDEYCCPADLKKLGHELVAKCDGLPLAIIVLGGLLSRKELHEWRAVKDHLWREVKNGSIHISLLLALSFKDLPQHLKPCFLYIGLFPEDFVINAEKLMHMWIAEGFVSQREGLDMEEVAEDYLNELMGRSLIQVVRRKWRGIARFRVHDLLRDLAVDKAKDLNFLHVYDKNMNSTCLATVSLCRRLASHSNSKNILLDVSNPRLRTLLFLNNNSQTEQGKFQLIVTKFKLLRRLDLEGVNFFSGGTMKLPDTVGELIHLKYLGLVNTLIRKLPESIGKLQALETIEASIDTEIRLPRGIWKLKQLRHLKGCFNDNWSYGGSTGSLLPNLRTLNLVRIRDSVLAFKGIAKLRNLKTFSTVLSRGMFSIEPLLNCGQLVELRIDGNIGNIPEEMHKFLPNIKYLELRNSELEQDPSPRLERFPELMVLWLENIGVKTMTFTARGYPQLQVLALDDELEKVEVEEGAMPRLRALNISGTSELARKFQKD